MQRVHWIEHDTRRTGAGQGGRNFLAYIARFANPDDDDLAPGTERRNYQFNAFLKTGVKLSPNSPQTGQLNIEDLSRSCQVGHSFHVLTFHVLTFLTAYSLSGNEPRIFTKL